MNSGKYLGMDWEIEEEKTNFGRCTTIGIRVYDKRHIFRHGASGWMKGCDSDWTDLIKVKLIGWMERTFFKYDMQNKFKQFFIRTFGKRYEDAIGFRGKWYLK